jgi:hypothetical protein
LAPLAPTAAYRPSRAGPMPRLPSILIASATGCQQPTTRALPLPAETTKGASSTEGGCDEVPSPGDLRQYLFGLRIRMRRRCEPLRHGVHHRWVRPCVNSRSVPVHRHA